MRYAVLIATLPNYPPSECFREVAETIDFGLNALGHDSVVTNGAFIEGRTHIILGAHLLLNRPHLAPPDSIIYNLEQLQDNDPRDIRGYVEFIRRFRVWDFAESNVAFLKKLGVTVEVTLPICYYAGLERIQPAAVRDIDVLFIGTVNKRRAVILEMMRTLGLKVVDLFGSYGGARDEYIARSKVLLNIHYYEAKILELVRISYYLANKCAVLSERSGDRGVDEAWAKGVVFSPYMDLPFAASQLCRDENKRRDVAAKGYRLMKSLKIEAELKRALRLTNR